MTTKYTELKEAIVKAVENLSDADVAQFPDQFREEFFYHYRPIRLSDVLVAMRQAKGATDSDQFWLIEDCDRKNTWNLRTDSLEAQSPETIDFLHGIICKTV